MELRELDILPPAVEDMHAETYLLMRTFNAPNMKDNFHYELLRHKVREIKYIKKGSKKFPTKKSKELAFEFWDIVFN